MFLTHLFLNDKENMGVNIKVTLIVNMTTNATACNAYT